jgi:RimJ/RimL family protein N-acetyltransferase
MLPSSLFNTAENGLSLRLATLDDAPSLLAWRNDPETRRSCRNTALVQRGEHARWLAELLRDSNRHLLIITAHGQPCGQVRMDMTDKHMELSWTIAPEFRRRGYARQILSQIVQALPSEKLTAWIRPENIASIRAAETAGFCFVETCGNFHKYETNRLEKHTREVAQFV